MPKLTPQKEKREKKELKITQQLNYPEEAKKEKNKKQCLLL